MPDTTRMRFALAAAVALLALPQSLPFTFTPAQPDMSAAGTLTNAWADYDADGDLDLFVAMRDRPNFMLINHGGRFEDASERLGLADPRKSVGAVWLDYDQDGDLDLALAGTTSAPMPLLLRNGLAPTSGRSLHVRVVDARGRATRAGAEVRVFLAGTRRLLGARIVDAGSGYNAQSDLPVHVGLPAAVGRVDLQVIFPGRGRRAV